MVDDRVSVIIPGRAEPYFQKTIDYALERATGDVEVIAVVDGPEQRKRHGPIVATDERVKAIELDKSIGQREAYNLGVENSTGEYVMKIDAHALMSEGYDEALRAHCPEKTTVIPEMRRLNPQNWEAKPRGRTHFMYFGLDLYCHYWSGYRKREEARVEYPEVLTAQGSCWFTRRDWNDWIGLLDPGVGSWGNVGIEVSLRTWLCGGTQICNKHAWQAHWFRVGEGGFTYPMSGRQVAKAHRYTWNNYYFKDDAFEHQVRPFYWLIDKFKPVPTWETYLSDRYESPRVIVYYTDSELDFGLAHAVRKNLKKVAGPIPIISVSQKPLNLGKNICVGKLPRTFQSMYQQILKGAKAAPPGSIIYLCEHDVFYHPSHFAKLPKDKRAFYFNQNRYYYREGCDTYLPGPTASKALSQAVVSREYLIEHCERRLADWTPRAKHRRYSWSSERPNVDIRHDQNLSQDGGSKRAWITGKKKGVRNIGGWGSPKHFRSKSGYKGMLRGDVIQHLMKRYGYESYLEIGAKSGDTFKRVQAKVKHGVDPRKGAATHVMTSDEFFAQSTDKYDLIFIDGLHESEQVKKDIANSLEHLTDNGVIVMHDCSPRNKAEQQMPKPKRGIWTGDVWKAFVYYRRRPDLEMYVVNTNNGCGVIRWGEQEPLVVDDPTYAEFEANREEWLNLKTTGEFRQWENQRGA